MEAVNTFLAQSIKAAKEGYLNTRFVAVAAIHQKIKNQRKDYLHKLSKSLVENYSAIFIGNVNASALARSKHAKSVLDASWSTFRAMLKYKCEHAAVWFEENGLAHRVVVFTTVTRMQQ